MVGYIRYFEQPGLGRCLGATLGRRGNHRTTGCVRIVGKGGNDTGMSGPEESTFTLRLAAERESCDRVARQVTGYPLALAAQADPRRSVWNPLPLVRNW